MVSIANKQQDKHLHTMAPHATADFVGHRVDSPCSIPQNTYEDHTRETLSSSEDLDLIEPVAIVGFSFKFPQDASSPESFWKMLMEQRSTATDIPMDRLSASAIYHPDPNRRGTVSIPVSRVLDCARE